MPNTTGGLSNVTTEQPQAASETAVEEDAKVAQWHEKILTEALKWREQHPDFRFSLRTADVVVGKPRLSRGYWFPGADRYLFFPPFKVNDSNNKTKTIGFVVEFMRSRQVRRSYLEVVFGSLTDPALIAVHKAIVSQLGPFTKSRNSDKYQRPYAHTDPLQAFSEFLEVDYRRIRGIIEAAGQGPAFFVTE